MASLKRIPAQKEINSLKEPIDISSQVQIIDSGDSNIKSAEIILMEAGWNENNFYFSNERLKELPEKIMKKKKLYMNHEFFFSASRPIEWWMGTFRNVEYEEENGVGRLKGLFDFTNNPNTLWIYDEIKRDPSEVHFSTHLQGYTEEGEIEGRKGRIVTSWADYSSTDCVSYGAARGRALRIANSLSLPFDNEEFIEYLKNYKSITKQKGEEIMDTPVIRTKADLQAQNPELLESIVNGAISAYEQKQDIKNKEVELANLKNEKATFTSKITELEKAITNLKNEKAIADTEIQNLKKERDELKVKVDNYELIEKIANKKENIKKLSKDLEL